MVSVVGRIGWVVWGGRRYSIPVLWIKMPGAIRRRGIHVWRWWVVRMHSCQVCLAREAILQTAVHHMRRVVVV